MVKKFFLILLFIAFGLLVGQHDAQAGFGISPPYVKSKKPLFPGAHYEQRITLLRSSADEELEARVIVEAPDVASWITVDKGEVFNLPVGKLQVPMIVKIDVPDSAEIGNYGGHINIQVAPKGKLGGGGVSIALGARVDIELAVTNEVFIDFLVRSVKLSDIEILKKPWNWPMFSWFFYRLKVVMRIENTGNVKIAPTKVDLDVYDITEKILLESHTDKRIKKLEPFTTGEITASYPTKLKPGQYWGKLKIYKDNDIVHKDKMVFTVYPPGESPSSSSLGIWSWILLGFYFLIILLIIFILIKIKIWRYLFKLLYVLSWPFRYVYKKLRILFRKIKLKFWKWVHKKSEKYQEINKTEDNVDDQEKEK